MLYFANPCGPAVVAAMTSGTGIGLIDTPGQQKPMHTDAAHAGGAVWVADNGAFSNNFDENTWWLFLIRNAHRAATCAFAVAPDVVGDAVATLERSLPWLPKIRGLGYPVAFVAQDGIEDIDVPWDEFDCLFIGGSTEFKLGSVARRYAAEAKRRGKWLHCGRVNSQRRFEYCRAIGCDSVDGTYLTYGPDVNLPRLLGWFRALDQTDVGLSVEGGTVTHVIDIIDRSEYDHTFRCSCGAGPDPRKGVLKTRQMAIDDANKHLAYIDRVRRTTVKRGETLEQAYAHYAEMAANTNLPQRDRDQWQRLADETGHRLGVGVEAVQEELFPMGTRQRAGSARSEAQAVQGGPEA